MIFKIKIFIEKNSKHFVSYKLYTVHSTGRRNTRFLNIRRDFTVKFAQSRVPSKQAVREIVKKFDTTSTILNLNSKKSPGKTYSGQPKLGIFYSKFGGFSLAFEIRKSLNFSILYERMKMRREKSGKSIFDLRSNN